MAPGLREPEKTALHNPATTSGESLRNEVHDQHPTLPLAVVACRDISGLMTLAAFLELGGAGRPNRQGANERSSLTLAQPDDGRAAICRQEHGDWR